MKTILKYAAPALFFLFIFNPVKHASQTLNLKDDQGDTLILETPPQRIISLAPNVTEILFILGLEDRIVGVTRYCNYPKKAQTKNRIGGLVDPDLEKIIDFHPDLIIAFRGNPLTVIQRLKSLDLPVFVLESGTTLESVLSLIQRIGRVTWKEKTAKDLIDHLNRDFNEIKERLYNERRRPKVFINLHGKGLWTSGKNSFMNDLVKEAKGRNIAGEVPRAWFSYNREELIHNNPDHILVLAKTEKDFLEVKKWFEQEAHLENINAVQKDKISFLNEDLVTRPGPRIFEAFAQIARILHPSVFEDDK